jgi:Cas7 group CRISPR-associated protein Csh2
MANKVTGLIIIEVIHSNPNGDPNCGGDPRQLPDGRGIISSVSIKRKVRDLIELKDGPIFQNLVSKGIIDNNDIDKFCIMETEGRDRDLIGREIKSGIILDKYCDARIFGGTFLEKKKGETKKGFTQGGPLQMGMGYSSARINIDRMTFTNKSGVEEGKSSGMAPFIGFVEHGVYYVDFHINPSLAVETNCTERDISVFKETLPFIYDHTASFVRTNVHIRHIWWAEHKTPRGSYPVLDIIDHLKPKRIGSDDPFEPSTRWEDYEVPKLPDTIKDRLLIFEDLMDSCYL